MKAVESKLLELENHVKQKLFEMANRWMKMGNSADEVHEQYGMATAEAQAQALYRKTLAGYVSIFGKDDAHDIVADSTHNLGRLLAKKGEWTEAEAMFRKCLATNISIHGTDEADLDIRHLFA